MSIRKTRALSHELNPVVDRRSGLVSALEWLAQKMEDQFGLKVRLKAHTDRQVEDETVNAFLYRAVHELLFNTVKHAGVKTAEVLLSDTDGSFCITVSDQGNGFDSALLNSGKAKAGLGLQSLTNRVLFMGGRLNIESAPGEGSRFTLTVPQVPADGKDAN